MRKIDVIIIAVLVLLALGWFGWRKLREDEGSEALMYVVLVDGVEVASGMLDGPTLDIYETDGTGDRWGIETVSERANNAPLLFSVPGRSAVLIRVEDGSAAFHASDCPDQICVHTGYITSSGQSAACLPNGVILLIRGGAPGDAGGVDAVADSDAVVGSGTVAELRHLGTRP